jgi:hypothetical protein
VWAPSAYHIAMEVSVVSINALRPGRRAQSLWIELVSELFDDLG